MDEHRLFRFSRPQWLTNTSARSAGVYAAGALFALGFYTLLDAATYSHSALNPTNFHLTFLDWVPMICSALGMLIINSIDKSRLSADTFSYSGNGVAWKARAVLFVGFALMAGGLAGSVTVLVLKYVVRSVEWPTLWLGVGGVVGNAGIMLSSVVLWVAQNLEDEYTYSLAL